MIKREETKGATRVVVERALPPARSAEEREREEYESSHLADLVEKMGGQGTAKVYRILDGRDCYAVSWPADQALVDTVEEKLAELGGGRYRVKLYWKSKCMGAPEFNVDPHLHPIRKTAAEERRGETYGTPEIAQLVSQAVAQTMAPLMQLLAGRNDNAGLSEVLRLHLESNRQYQQSLERQNDRLLEAFSGRSASPAPQLGDQLSQMAKVVRAVDDIRGPQAATADGKRSLAMRFVEGPLEKAVVHVADKVVERYLDSPDGQQGNPQLSRPPVPVAPPPQVASPPNLPPRGPTVTMPQGVRPLDQAELSRQRAGQRPPAPAPMVADALPAAAQKNS